MARNAEQVQGRKVVAVVVNCEVRSGRLDVQQHDIERDGDWERLLRAAEERLESRWGEPTGWTVQVQALTSSEQGIVRTTLVQWCEACACFKVPGKRHQHDVRRAPVEGAVVRAERTWKRWTGSEAWEQVRNVSGTDPRWEPHVRHEVLRVTKVEQVEAWSFGENSFPAETRVHFTATLTGDWTPRNGEEERPPEGSSDCTLEEWRQLVRGWEVVAR